MTQSAELSASRVMQDDFRLSFNMLYSVSSLKWIVLVSPWLIAECTCTRSNIPKRPPSKLGSTSQDAAAFDSAFPNIEFGPRDANLKANSSIA